MDLYRIYWLAESSAAAASAIGCSTEQRLIAEDPFFYATGELVLLLSYLEIYSHGCA